MLHPGASWETPLSPGGSLAWAVAAREAGRLPPCSSLWGASCIAAAEVHACMHVLHASSGGAITQGHVLHLCYPAAPDHQTWM